MRPAASSLAELLVQSACWGASSPEVPSALTEEVDGLPGSVSEACVALAKKDDERRGRRVDSCRHEVQLGSLCSWPRVLSVVRVEEEWA